MSGLVAGLVAVLVLWMIACGICGARRNFKQFAAALIVGLTINMVWMMIRLNAHPLEDHALMAQASVTLCALCAFGFGWIAGRILDAWRQSTIES